MPSSATANQAPWSLAPGRRAFPSTAHYNISEHLSAQLNVENLFQERYFLFANSNTNITPGSPRAFKVSLNARF
jgi:catecholate siderophore receptor